jgi:hypothetical protein
MLRMRRVGQHGLELLVAPPAAHILRWAGATARDTPRIAHPRFRRDDLLHGEPVGPVVAEVVQVAERVTLFDQPEQLALGLVGDALVVPVRIRYPVPLPVDHELMQVGVGPAHRRLHHLMQHGQVHLARNLHPPLDRRLNLFQHDLDLEDLRPHSHTRCGHAPMLTAPPEAAGAAPPLLK